jgi:hypothetical protein
LFWCFGCAFSSEKRQRCHSTSERNRSLDFLL